MHDHDQPPGDIDLVMAIKVQLHIIPMDYTPPMFVTVGAQSYLYQRMISINNDEEKTQ